MAVKSIQALAKEHAEANRPQTIAGAPEGYDGKVLADLAVDAKAGVLHITIDDAALDRTAETVAFFKPDLEVIRFYGWDCLPYDRVSPNSAITARRLDALTSLAGSAACKRVVITTISAILQRLPPRNAFASSTFLVKRGQNIDLEAFRRFPRR